MNDLAEEFKEAVSCFRKATYEFATHNNIADHEEMLRWQRRLFELFESVHTPEA